MLAPQEEGVPMTPASIARTDITNNKDGKKL